MREARQLNWIFSNTLRLCSEGIELSNLIKTRLVKKEDRYVLEFVLDLEKASPFSYYTNLTLNTLRREWVTQFSPHKSYTEAEGSKLVFPMWNDSCSIPPVLTVHKIILGFNNEAERNIAPNGDGVTRRKPKPESSIAPIAG